MKRMSLSCRESVLRERSRHPHDLEPSDPYTSPDLARRSKPGGAHGALEALRLDHAALSTDDVLVQRV
jgi:hypothetical protein